MEIPKIIHYCWFGHNPLPELAKKCIDSWRVYLPNYEIWEWNEENFDVNKISYTAEAYKAKKYAFVSDYARFFILYKYGGLYFDTDVEIVRPIDDIVKKGPFMGYEDENGNPIEKIKCVAPGLGLGFPPGFELIKEIIDIYESRHLFTWDGKLMDTVGKITTALLLKKGISRSKDGYDCVGNITLYPEDFFCPKNYYTGEIVITKNTRTIHHYSATWVKENKTIWEKIKKRSCMFYYRVWGEIHSFKKNKK